MSALQSTAWLSSLISSFLTTCTGHPIIDTWGYRTSIKMYFPSQDHSGHGDCTIRFSDNGCMLSTLCCAEWTFMENVRPCHPTACRVQLLYQFVEYASGFCLAQLVKHGLYVLLDMSTLYTPHTQSIYFRLSFAGMNQCSGNFQPTIVSNFPTIPIFLKFSPLANFLTAIMHNVL